MITMDVKVGQAVQVGEEPECGAVVTVMHKSGRTARLSFATRLPVRLLTTGIIPARFTFGVTGEPRRILEAVA